MNDERNNAAGVRNSGAVQCFSNSSKSAESNSVEETNHLTLVPVNGSNNGIDKASEAEGAELRELIESIQKRQSNQLFDSVDENLPPAA